jgi:two-component system LytT family sensor kinase
MAKATSSAQGDAPDGWPALQLGPALVLLAVFLAVTTAQGIASDAAFRAHGLHRAFVPILAGQYTGALAAWIALPIVQLAVRRAGVPPGLGWWRFGLVHVGGYVAFAAVHAGTMVLLRTIVGHVLGGSPFGPVVAQVAYEVRADLILYPALAGLWYALLVREERRKSALRAAELERALVESRLDALTARLDPHFLFNTLHTISAVMYQDLARTETLLANLGELLRVTLDTSRPSWTVDEERTHTERYSVILRERFGDRLVVSWTIDPRARTRTIPRFAIQMLVENAVKHNERSEPLHVEIDVALEDEVLRIEVGDDGRGLDPSLSDKPGRGLSRLEETLRLAHGARASLERSSTLSGGARIVLSVPEAA